ncbi:FeoA family protein [Clostridium tetani]|uniref:FeoA family protein n=1 Tax=Clostridium tetani TaxID=1513 RepID=UPI00030C69F4|nr:ferrous iron transport protein A [Clostridium tetani]QBD84601.1 ferrous iron transport protein A [Clostridium tetani]QBD86950.1 ferrous iron transport protein A [Clostridium tetani]RXI46387.1 ferrous iron transport protein A [Clostridium tetani]RXI55119.1 ferrous iron transport protein A [Clostridium tetani]RXI56898.1 ferrous iron transport protein A [Clostridium tetani]
MTLNELKIGEKAYINTISGNDKLAKRLLALGCIKGTEICIKKVAPFGDPIIINLRGFDLALRKKDAKNISIEDSLETVERMAKIYDNCCISG